MITDEIQVVCTDDLWYEDLLIAKKGETYDVLSYASKSVILRGENDMDAIINGVNFRKHFLVMTGGGNSNGDFSN